MSSSDHPAPPRAGAHPARAPGPRPARPARLALSARLAALAAALGLAACSCSCPGEPAPAERFELANGLRVVLRAVPRGERVAVVVLFDVGGDHDPPGRSGLAHLVEHVYVSAAAGAAPARTAEEFFQAHPLGWNAQTGDRYTVVAAVVSAADLQAELADAASRLSDLRVTEADLARERPRLAAELANMFAGMPALAAANLARERVRPAPRGGRRGGRPEQLAQVSAAELQERWRTLYRPRNAILVVAGGFDAAATRAQIERRFAGIPAGEPAPPPAEPDAARPGDEAIAAPPGEPGFASVAWAAPAPGSRDYAALLAVAIRLVPRGQLRYAALDDPAVVQASGPVPPGTTPAQAAELLGRPLAQALADPPGRFELARRAATLGLAPPGDEVVATNPYFAAFVLGRLQQLGVDPAALDAALRQVTAADLARLQREVLSPARRATVVVAPPGS